MNSRLVKSLFAVALSAMLFSCGAAEVEKGFGDAASVGDDDGNDGVVSGVGFYLKLNSTSWPVNMALHKFWDISAPCMVQKNSVMPESDVSCVLNIREYDLMFSDISWEFNAPPGMCAYVEETPYYFYGEQPGVGPKQVNVALNAAGRVTDCNVDGTDYTPDSNGVCSFPEGRIDSTGEPKCIYDYSDKDGPNCCTGSATITKVANGTPTVSTKSWGGKAGNCLDGNFRLNSWKVYDKTGFPFTVVRNAAAGRNNTYEAHKGQDNLKNAMSLFAANFFDWDSYANASQIYPGTTSTNVPLAIRYNQDISGDSMTPGNASYLYECKDESGETTARIRLYVNQWDTNNDFNSYLAGAPLTSVNPNRTGIDGVNCAETSVSTSYCDDFYQWDSKPSPAATPTFRNRFPGMVTE